MSARCAEDDWLRPIPTSPTSIQYNSSEYSYLLRRGRWQVAESRQSDRYGVDGLVGSHADSGLIAAMSAQMSDGASSPGLLRGGGRTSEMAIITLCS